MGGTDTLINVEGLTGTNSNDTLTGGMGDQWFRGRGGSDTINGGSGNDWVTYSSDPSGVSIDLSTGIATDGFNGVGGFLALGGTDTLTSIENAEGSDYGDFITGNNGATSCADAPAMTVSRAAMATTLCRVATATICWKAERAPISTMVAWALTLRATAGP